MNNLGALLFFTFFLNIINSNNLKISAEKIRLDIDMNTKSEEINEYKSLLRKKNIDLSVYFIAYNKDKTIKEIEITVDCNDGFKGSSKKVLYPGKKMGFIRNFTNNAKVPFELF